MKSKPELNKNLTSRTVSKLSKMKIGKDKCNERLDIQYFIDKCDAKQYVSILANFLQDHLIFVIKVLEDKGNVKLHFLVSKL